MADNKIVYLIVDRGGSELPALWRVAGYAYACRDGSLNVKLDIHPGLKFNIRDPKSNGEREDAGGISKTGNGHPNETAKRQTPAEAKKVNDDDIPF